MEEVLAHHHSDGDQLWIYSVALKLKVISLGSADILWNIKARRVSGDLRSHLDDVTMTEQRKGADEEL